MKNQIMTMSSSAPLITILCLTNAALFSTGCKQEAWEGKFVAPKGNNCSVLDFVNVYPDKTADVKFQALSAVGNFPSYFDEKDSLLIIKETNRQWAFKLSNDTLYEVSNLDQFCYLVRKK